MGSNQQYLKLKITQLAKERETKKAQLEEIEQRVIAYAEQLDPEARDELLAELAPDGGPDAGGEKPAKNASSK